MSHSASAARVWTTPAMLALSTAAGLAAGLLGDGVWDSVGWCALGLPLVVALRCLARRPGAQAAAIPSRTPARRL